MQLQLKEKVYSKLEVKSQQLKGQRQEGYKPGKGTGKITVTNLFLALKNGQILINGQKPNPNDSDRYIGALKSLSSLDQNLMIKVPVDQNGNIHLTVNFLENIVKFAETATAKGKETFTKALNIAVDNRAKIKNQNGDTQAIGNAGVVGYKQDTGVLTFHE